MANPERGEVDLKAKGKTYILQLTWNEIAEFEAVNGVAWFEDFAPKLLKPNTISGGEWRALLWAGLHRNHPEITLIDAGDLLTAIGIKPAAEQMMLALRFTFPDPEEVSTENPPPAGP